MSSDCQPTRKGGSHFCKCKKMNSFKSLNGLQDVREDPRAANTLLLTLSDRTRLNPPRFLAGSCEVVSVTLETES